MQIIIFGIIAVAIVVFVKCSKLIAKANANLKMLDENNENSLCNVNYLSSSLKYSNIDSNAYFTAYVESKEKLKLLSLYLNICVLFMKQVIKAAGLSLNY